MGIILDVILVAFVILNLIMGYKKGLIGVIFNICAFLIAIIVTLVLFKPVSTYIIDNTSLDDYIKNVILSNNSQSVEKDEENQTSIQKYIENNIKDIQNKTQEQVMEVVASNISQRAVEIITAILIFIVTRIVVALLKFLLEGLADLPIVKQFNQAGGIVYGAVKSVLIVYIFLTVLFVVVSINCNGIVAEMIDTSYVTKVLYDNNIIVKYCLFNKNLL